jgi:hypothetical protein
MTIAATAGEKFITAQLGAVAAVPFKIHPSSIMAVENRNTHPLEARGRDSFDLSQPHTQQGS